MASPVVSRVFMRLLTKKLPTDTKDCCSMIGIEATASSLKIFLLNISGFSSVLKAFSFFMSTITVSTQAMTCDMNVAHAAPATSRWNTQTSNKSSPMLSTEDMTRKINGVFESPSADSMPQPRLYRNMKGSAPT